MISNFRFLIAELIICALLITGCSPRVITERITVHERVDTLRVAGDTVVMEGSGVVVYDTILVSNDNTPLAPHANAWSTTHQRGIQPFMASIDTTVERIRLIAKYSYPVNRWNVKIVQRDTVVRYVVRDSTKVESHVEKVYVTPWWNWVVLTLIGLAIIAKAVKKLLPKVGL